MEVEKGKTAKYLKEKRKVPALVLENLKEFTKIPDNYRNDALAKKWELVSEVRDAVLAAIEPKRADKTIGSSLEAHASVTLSEAHFVAVQGLELNDICIVSQCDIVKGDGLSVTVTKAEGNKCERCWKVLPEVGTDKDFPTLTLRDADAVRWYMQQSKAA